MKQSETSDGYLAAALQSVVGAALVLDAALRIRAATPGASRLLGLEIPLGIAAPALLCGQGPKRPFAEALAAGKPIQTVIAGPGAGRTARRDEPPAGAQLVRVQAMPLGKLGWLVTMEPAHEAFSHEPLLFQGMWTKCAPMKRVFQLIERAASEDVTVLVRGETGTGKELVARALHALSPRQRGPFRAINCAALPANLLDSELFGHAKGAFTGAVKDTPGHIQAAHGGTLFLDEVAEMPPELQAKLLRVLETHTVIPVGGRDAIPVDVRIISATHRALRREVEAGRFRADLMYRLRVIPVFLPPLRERPDDVLLLARQLLAEINAGSKRRALTEISPAAEQALRQYPWPGNVRELRNALAYAHVMGDAATLHLADLPPEIAAAAGAEPVAGEPGAAPSWHDEARGDVLGDVRGDARVDDEAQQAARIRQALARAGGNRDRAAKLLGTSRVTLWRRMRALGLSA